MSMLHLDYQVPGDDFTRAGEASGDVKHKLKKLGYEPDRVDILLQDHGPGIKDVDQAMQAGWSTAPDNVRALGFGAGMGLPNMKKYTDEMEIDSVVGEGTKVRMVVYPGKKGD